MVESKSGFYFYLECVFSSFTQAGALMRPYFQCLGHCFCSAGSSVLFSNCVASKLI